MFKELFLDTSYTNISYICFRVSVFLLLSILIVWLILLVFNRMSRHSDVHREYQIKLNLLSSLCVFFLFFSCYIFFFVKLAGLHSFYWSNPEFYLGILGQLIVYVGNIVIFCSLYLVGKKLCYV